MNISIPNAQITTITDRDYAPLPQSTVAPSGIAQQLLEEAFSHPRDPRSSEYMAGMLYQLRVRLEDAQRTGCPYPAGTASADAWSAGCEEGLTLCWRLSNAKEARA